MDLEQRSSNKGWNKILSTHPEVLDGNGNKKHSETLLEVGDANRSSMLSEEVADRNGNSNYFEIHPGFPGVSEGGDHFQTNPEIYLEVVDMSQSNKKSDPHLELTGSDDVCKPSRIEPNASVKEGHEPIPARKLGFSSSSSSSFSSIEDLFQVDVNDVTKSILPKANEDIRPTPIVDEIEDCIYNNPKSGVLDNVSLGLTSTSQSSGITSEQLANAVCPTTQSPPIQTMDRSEGYDPLRIPSSIFASKPPTPMEWSVASNESLFSLHIGNNSLRDRVFVFGDLNKSEELTKSGELFMLSPPPATVDAGADGHFSEDAQNVGKNATKSNKEKIREQNAQAPAICRTSNHVNGNEISRNSFTSPIKKKCAWRLCYLCNCCCTFCYCIRSRLCFRWPTCFCSNCKWPSCCNCSNCKCHSRCCSKCKWPSCHCCNCRQSSCYCSGCGWAFCCHWNCIRK